MTRRRKGDEKVFSKLALRADMIFCKDMPTYITCDDEEEKDILARGNVVFLMNKDEREICKKATSEQYWERYGKANFPNMNFQTLYSIEEEIDENLKNMKDHRIDLSGKLSNEEIFEKVIKKELTDKDFVIVDLEYAGQLFNLDGYPVTRKLKTSEYSKFESVYFDLEKLTEVLKANEQFDEIENLGNASELSFTFTPTDEQMRDMWKSMMTTDPVALGRDDELLETVVYMKDFKFDECLTKEGRTYFNLEDDMDDTSTFTM